MGFTFSLFIVLSALIAFLVFYYFTNQKEEIMEERKPKMADVELGKELGVTKDKLESEEEEEIPGENTNRDLQSKNSSLQKKDIIEGDYSWLENELKYKYNKTFIRLFSRDPNLLYSYWEVNISDYYNNSPWLRLFSSKKDNFRDIKLEHGLENFYVSGINPNEEYQIAVGYKQNGVFNALAYSDWVTTPPDRPSDVIDERWMTIEDLYEEEVYEIRLNSSESLVKSIKRRKKKEEENADSYSFSYKD